MTTRDYQPVEDAFRDGHVVDADDETLTAYLLALANQPIANERVQHRDIIRGLTVNQIILKRYFSRLNRENNKLAILVLILTVASLLGAAAQIWFAYKADKRSETESQTHASQQQEQAHKQAAPFQQARQAVGQSSGASSALQISQSPSAAKR
jgi:hypothetical protein